MRKAPLPRIAFRYEPLGLWEDVTGGQLFWSPEEETEEERQRRLAGPTPGPTFTIPGTPDGLGPQSHLFPTPGTPPEPRLPSPDDRFEQESARTSQAVLRLTESMMAAYQPPMAPAPIPDTAAMQPDLLAPPPIGVEEPPMGGPELGPVPQLKPLGDGFQELPPGIDPSERFNPVHEALRSVVRRGAGFLESATAMPALAVQAAQELNFPAQIGRGVGKEIGGALGLPESPYPEPEDAISQALMILNQPHRKRTQEVQELTRASGHVLSDPNITAGDVLTDPSKFAAIVPGEAAMLGLQSLLGAVSGPAGFIAPMAVDEAGGTFLDVYDKTGGDVELAARAGLGSGIINSALEYFPAMGIVAKRVPGVEEVFQRVVGKVVSRIGSQMSAEGLTEAAQEAVNAAVKFAATKDPEELANLGSRMGLSGVLGAILGGGAASLQVGAEHGQRKRLEEILAGVKEGEEALGPEDAELQTSPDVVEGGTSESDIRPDKIISGAQEPDVATPAQAPTEPSPEPALTAPLPEEVPQTETETVPETVPETPETVPETVPETEVPAAAPDQNVGTPEPDADVLAQEEPAEEGGPIQEVRDRLEHLRYLRESSKYSTTAKAPPEEIEAAEEAVGEAAKKLVPNKETDTALFEIRKTESVRPKLWEGNRAPPESEWVADGHMGFVKEGARGKTAEKFASPGLKGVVPVESINKVMEGTDKKATVPLRFLGVAGTPSVEHGTNGKLAIFATDKGEIVALHPGYVRLMQQVRPDIASVTGSKKDPHKNGVAFRDADGRTVAIVMPLNVTEAPVTRGEIVTGLPGAFVAPTPKARRTKVAAGAATPEPAEKMAASVVKRAGSFDHTTGEITVDESLPPKKAALVRKHEETHRDYDPDAPYIGEQTVGETAAEWLDEVERAIDMGTPRADIEATHGITAETVDHMQKYMERGDYNRASLEEEVFVTETSFQEVRAEPKPRATATKPRAPKKPAPEYVDPEAEIAALNTARAKEKATPAKKQPAAPKPKRKRTEEEREAGPTPIPPERDPATPKRARSERGFALLPKFASATPVVESTVPEVEARLQEAKGKKRTPLMRRMAEGIEELRQEFTRHFQHLDTKASATLAVAADYLRQYEATPGAVKTMATHHLAEVQEDLDNSQIDLMTKSLVVNDALRAVDEGLYDETDPASMERQFGYRTRAEMVADKLKWEAAVAADPKVAEALKKRTDFTRRLTEALVANGLLGEAALDNVESYYHRQVTEYLNDPDRKSLGLGARDVRLHKRGFQKQRTGGTDFNTSFAEAEFEWVSQALTLLIRKQTLAKVRRVADVAPDLKQQAKDLKKQTGQDVDWRELIPDGYTLWQPEVGNYLYKAFNIAESTMNEIMATGGADVTVADVREVLALGGKKAQWVIPDGLARTLNDFVPKSEGKFGRASAKILGAWKQYVLLNPMNAIKYNVNNLSGDMDIAIAYSPKIVTNYLPRAMRDLRRMHQRTGGQALKEEYEASLKDGTLSASISIQEIPDVHEQQAWDAVTSRDAGVVETVAKRYWGGVRNLTTFRENALRLAAKRYFQDQLKAGKNLYGASKRYEIDAITDRDQKAAKLGRELIGDYGNVSAAGQYIRRHMIPFYSWMEINAPRYYRLLSNLPAEGRGARKGEAAARVGAALAARTALKGGTFALKSTAMYGLIQLWNHAMFPDEERELRKEAREAHIILGRNADGSIRTLRFEGALADALEWFDAQDIAYDIGDIREGRATLKDKLADAIKAPDERIVQAWEPVTKSLFEIITGRSAYPRLYEPGYHEGGIAGGFFKTDTRVIRDKVEYAERLLSLNKVIPPIAKLYEQVTGERPEFLMKPIRPGSTNLADIMVFYRTDPGEAAYFTIREESFKWMEENVREFSAAEPTRRANALYYYKKAVMWNDDSARDFWYNRYKELGGTKDGMKRSIKMSSPLGAIPEKHRKAFVAQLSSDEREILETARMFYRRVYTDGAPGFRP